MGGPVWPGSRFAHCRPRDQTNGRQVIAIHTEWFDDNMVSPLFECRESFAAWQRVKIDISDIMLGHFSK
jgi:hypothetical protein